jgi:hypothetical protein
MPNRDLDISVSMVSSEQGTTRVHGCERHDCFSGLGQDPFMDRISILCWIRCFDECLTYFVPLCRWSQTFIELQVFITQGSDLQATMPSKSNVRQRSSTARRFIDGTLSLQISRSIPREGPSRVDHSFWRFFCKFSTDISVAKAYIDWFSSKQTTCILASEPGTSDSPASWICRSHSKHPSDYHIPQDFQASTSNPELSDKNRWCVFMRQKMKSVNSAPDII